MKNNKSYSDIVVEITELTIEGNDILEVDFGNGDTNFFLVDSFEPPIGGTVHTAPYLQFNGILINDFFSKNIFSQTNRSSFISAFNDRYVVVQKQSFKFSEVHSWRFYSK